MKETLGGDRLGSGAGMKIDLHDYGRSNFDLGYLWKSTMAAGTLVPFMKELALPGDTFDIDLDAQINTLPTNGPLFGSYKLQLDVFFAPLKLYIAKLHNNSLNVGLAMQNVFLPQIRLFPEATTEWGSISNPDNIQINPSCILSYFDIRGMGRTNTQGTTFYRDFNAVPVIMYYDIYKCYYANKMENNGIYIRGVGNNKPSAVLIIQASPANTFDIPEYPNITTGTQLTAGRTLTLFNQGSGGPVINEAEVEFLESNGNWIRGNLLMGGWATGGTNDRTFTPTLETRSFLSWRHLEFPSLQPFPLINIDEMREAILKEWDTAYRINNLGLDPYAALAGSSVNQRLKGKQHGLCVKTYQSDLNNNWLNNEVFIGATGINEISRVSTSTGGFNIDNLILAQKVYNVLNRIAVSGATYDDWIRAVYGQNKYRNTENPIYCGGLSKEIVFQEVVSQSGTSSEPLGTLAGRGILAKKHKGGKVVIRCQEPGYIMGIVSITPRIDYSQGNGWDVNLKNMNELFKPELAQIGFQDLITDTMAWWDTRVGANGSIFYNSAGKQPAWVNYMSNVNKVRGNMAIEREAQFMTLTRRYEYNGSPGGTTAIRDLTTYIDPSKFNFVFADTSLDAQNFWVQIACDVTARRVMSSKVMPNI